LLMFEVTLEESSCDGHYSKCISRKEREGDPAKEMKRLAPFTN
jgi:hypothetical protein